MCGHGRGSIPSMLHEQMSDIQEEKKETQLFLPESQKEFQQQFDCSIVRSLQDFL